MIVVNSMKIPDWTGHRVVLYLLLFEGGLSTLSITYFIEDADSKILQSINANRYHATRSFMILQIARDSRSKENDL